MKKLQLILLLLFASVTVFAQKKHEKQIHKFQKELNASYANPESSPLMPEDLASFTSLDFFPIDAKLRIEAKFIRTEGSKPFKMKTSTDREPIYVKYGEAVFTIDGKEQTLSIYQSQTLSKTKEYEDYLFIPFTDLTCGEESYGGGRYLDLNIPKSDMIVLDFNKAYNPYCAYSNRYSCPVPPKENRLKVAIRAGVKSFKKHE